MFEVRETFNNGISRSAPLHTSSTLEAANIWLMLNRKVVHCEIDHDNDAADAIDTFGRMYVIERAKNG